MGIVFISDNPVSLNIDVRGRLHSENTPAMMYEDGYSLFYINGIKVPKWVIETPAEKLVSSKIMGLPNAEQRLASIKKLCAHNMLKDLGAKSISKKGKEYELFEVTLEGSKEKLLKMKNPSEEKTHYEWVEPQIKTVNEALAYRRGLSLFIEPVFKA